VVIGKYLRLPKRDIMKEEGAKKTLMDVTRWPLFTSPGGRCRLHHVNTVTDGHDYQGPWTRSQPSREV
jgi:hypothetical protein